MSEVVPSCMRAPPETVKPTTGSPSSVARSKVRQIFSPTTEPIEPIMNSAFMKKTAHVVAADLGAPAHDGVGLVGLLARRPRASRHSRGTRGSPWRRGRGPIPGSSRRPRSCASACGRRRAGGARSAGTRQGSGRACPDRSRCRQPGHLTRMWRSGNSADTSVIGPSRALMLFSRLLIEMLHQVGVVVPRDELGVGENVEVQLAVLGHAVDHELAEGGAHLADGLLAG